MSQYLVATLKQGAGRHISLALQDGDTFVLGRNPDLSVAPASSPGKRRLALKLGNVDGTVSRTHLWGRCEGRHLTVHRIQPDEGRNTPHPLVSQYGDREVLPDSITLNPGESFGIHSEGWFDFRWVDELEDVPHPAFDGVPSIEIEPQAKAVTGGGGNDLEKLYEELPRLFGHWEQPADLLTRVSEFLKTSLPSQHHVEVRFLAVEDGRKFRQLDRSADDDPRFRPSGRLLRDLYQGASALKGAARMVSAGPGSSVGAAGLQHSIDYPFDWMMALPVGSRRADPARPGKAATFQPFYYQGNPVCLYIETRESVGNDAKDFLPFVRLVNSLLAEALRAR